MKRLLVVAAVGAVALVMLPAAPASATPPLEVTIERDRDGGIPPPLVGSFVASGDAVDEGILCASGEFVDSPGPGGGDFPNVWSFRFESLLTCDDGSGSFLIQFHTQKNPSLEPDWCIAGAWNVLEGTDDYEKLHGTGKMFALPKGTCFPDAGWIGAIDIFTGRMHID